MCIPDRGLYTGIAIFGAIGSGNTCCCVYPFAKQILGYRATDAERRAAGLLLEVKGDFCHKVQNILKTHGREHDYFEISLDCPYWYNPLHNDLEAYAPAYGIASLLNNLFGRGKEPFWQQAYTNLVEFIILLHKVNYDYVTLFDVYECAINPDKLEMKIKEGKRLFQTRECVLVPDVEYLTRRDLAKFGCDRDPATNQMRAAIGIEPKPRTSIVEGISVFLSLFDDNPSVKGTFLPTQRMLRPRVETRWALRRCDVTVFTTGRRRKGLRVELPGCDESGACTNHWNSDETGFSAGGAQTAFLSWSTNQRSAGGKSSFFAMSIKASPQWGRAIRRATRCLRAVAPGEVHSHCRHTVDQFAAFDPARRIVAHFAADVPNEDLSGINRRRTRLTEIVGTASYAERSSACAPNSQFARGVEYSCEENNRDLMQGHIKAPAPEIQCHSRSLTADREVSDRWRSIV